MRFSMIPTRAFALVLPAAAIVLSLGATGPAMAEGDAGSWRYDRYVAQERAKEAAMQAAGRSGGTTSREATSESRESGVKSYAGQSDAPYHLSSTPHSRGGADR